VPAGRLRAEVMDLARVITHNAPLTVAASKAAIAEARQPAEQRHTARIAAMVEACFRSEDYEEGQAAFAAKRAPRFTGK
jgi:enoyl-CoA hydratase